MTIIPLVCIIADDTGPFVLGTPQPIICSTGTDYDLRLQVKMGNGDPLDLTGGALILTVRSTLPGADLQLSREAIVSDYPNGLADISVLQSDLALFTASRCVADIVYVDSFGSRAVVYPPQVPGVTAQTNVVFYLPAGVGQYGTPVTVPTSEQPLALGPAWPAVVADHAARDAIAMGARKIGMLVVTSNDLEMWQLQADLTTWVEFTGSGALSPSAHQVLHQMIHFIRDGPGAGFASGAYKETTGFPFPSSEIWYVDNTKAKKLFEIDYTYSGAFPTVIVYMIYEADGVTVLAGNTATDTIVYSGAAELNRTRVFT